MTALALSSISSVRRWLLAYPYTAVSFVLLAVLSVPFLRRDSDDSEWEFVYVKAAHQLRAGVDIYRSDIGNSYPPFATLVALPFTSLAPLRQRWLWLGINLGCLVFMLRAAWSLAGGGVLQGATAASWREHLAAILGGLCGLWYLQNSLGHQQTDIVLGALLFGGCVALSRERGFLAGTCFGLAAAVKCTPLLWAPYLLWRRRPVAAAWLIAVALGVNLLPDLVHPPEAGGLWLTEYANRYLRPLSASDHYVGTWNSALVYNQSLSGAGQRWFATTLAWADTDCIVSSRSDALGPRALRLLVLGVEAALLLLTLAICRRPFRRLPVDAPGTGMRNALEFSVVFTLMLLFSPMSSKAHFGTLLLPGFCIARAALVARRRWLLPLLGMAVLLALVSNKDLVGERLYTLTLWSGCVTWQTLLLLGGCLALLAGSDNRLSLAPAVPAPGDLRRRAA